MDRPPEQYQRDLQLESSNRFSEIKSKKDLFIFGITYMLVYASYAAFLGLQSSINIEDGLGATTLSIIFVTGAVSNILIVPFMIDFIGAKVAVVAGELSCLVYIAANAYPNWYTLISAAVINGLIGTAMLTSATVYVAFLADEYWMQHHSNLSNSKDKTKEANLTHFYAAFFAMKFTGDLIASGLVMFTLLGFQTYGLETRANTSIAFNEDAMLAGTEPPTLETVPVNYQFCASNECQSNYNKLNDTGEDLGNFKPNPISIHILLVICAMLCIIGVVIQCRLLPRHQGKYQKKTRKEVKAEKENDEEIEASIKSNIHSEVSQILHYFISPMHLLVVTFLFYSGMLIGFIMSDITRAYVSCIIGVEQVGVMFMVLSASTIVTSVLCSHIIPRAGEEWLLSAFFISNLVTWLLALLWVPTSENTWILYLFNIIYGVSLATMTNAVTVMISRYFPDILAIAFSGQNCIENIGVSFITGWTLELCVSTKIYMLIGFMQVSVLGVMGAEMLKRCKEKRTKANKNVGDQKDYNVTFL